jgi:hypothetical protein
MGDRVPILSLSPDSLRGAPSLPGPAAGSTRLLASFMPPQIETHLGNSSTTPQLGIEGTEIRRKPDTYPERDK